LAARPARPPDFARTAATERCPTIRLCGAHLAP
jgi:hypothetical protein